MTVCMSDQIDVYQCIIDHDPYMYELILIIQQINHFYPQQQFMRSIYADYDREDAQCVCGGGQDPDKDIGMFLKKRDPVQVQTYLQGVKVVERKDIKSGKKSLRRTIDKQFLASLSPNPANYKDSTQYSPISVYSPRINRMPTQPAFNSARFSVNLSNVQKSSIKTAVEPLHFRKVQRNINTQHCNKNPSQNYQLNNSQKIRNLPVPTFIPESRNSTHQLNNSYNSPSSKIYIHPPTKVFPLTSSPKIIPSNPTSNSTKLKRKLSATNIPLPPPSILPPDSTPIRKLQRRDSKYQNTQQIKPQKGMDNQYQEQYHLNRSIVQSQGDSQQQEQSIILGHSWHKSINSNPHGLSAFSAVSKINGVTQASTSTLPQKSVLFQEEGYFFNRLKRK